MGIVIDQIDFVTSCGDENDDEGCTWTMLQ